MRLCVGKLPSSGEDLHICKAVADFHFRDPGAKYILWTKRGPKSHFGPPAQLWKIRSGATPGAECDGNLHSTLLVEKW